MKPRPRITLASRLRREGGFTIVEVLAALAVLTVGFFALAGAMGLGLKQVALGRQRQTATEVGNARVEHMRNLSYASVALSSQPAHSADPTNPDYRVSPDGTLFDTRGEGACPGAAGCEELIVDTGAGAVLHIEDPVVVGTTSMEVYQYATWVNDPNIIPGTHDYRRLTVIVQYKTPAITGVARFVRVSSFFTPETVTIGGSAQGATQGSPTPTPTPTPTPAPTVCPTDIVAPAGTFSIEFGTGSQAGYTSSPAVTLRMTLTDSCPPIEVEFSNDGVSFGSEITYDAANPTVSWTLTSGDGTKSVRIEVEDAQGNKAIIPPLSDPPITIVLDTTPPTTPGTLSRTVSCSGNDRTVSLSWGTSTDTNLAGYRVYRNEISKGWVPIGTTSSTTYQDTHDKNLDSVLYRVVAYDKAGNESLPTNEVSLAKHQCS